MCQALWKEGGCGQNVGSHQSSQPSLEANKEAVWEEQLICLENVLGAQVGG